MHEKEEVAMGVMTRMDVPDIAVATNPELTQFVGMRPVIFMLDGRRVPQARTVSVLGSFNNWNPETNPMVLDAGGRWTAKLLLPQGAHPYLFLVNGIPWNDPEDDGRVPSEWGGDYSLRVVNRKNGVSKG